MHPPCAATASLSLTPAVLIRPLADKMSAGELDQAFREAVTGDGPDGGWSIKNDERVKYVGKLEVAKGEDTTLKVRADSPSPALSSPPPSHHLCPPPQVTMEDYPEAGMSALKYYTIRAHRLSRSHPPLAASNLLTRMCARCAAAESYTK